MVRWVIPERGLWSIGTGLELGALAILFGGGGCALAAAATVDRVAYLTGVSRCDRCGRCGRPTLGTRWCRCVAAELGIEPAPPWWQRLGRWGRPHAAVVVSIFLGFVPVAGLAVWLVGRHRKLGPLASELTFAHFALCLLFFVGIEVADLGLGWFDAAAAFRRTWAPRAELTAIYLVGFALVAACRAG